MPVRHLTIPVSVDPYELKLEHCRCYGIICSTLDFKSSNRSWNLSRAWHKWSWAQRLSKNIPCSLAGWIAGSNQQAQGQLRHGKGVPRAAIVHVADSWFDNKHETNSKLVFTAYYTRLTLNNTLPFWNTKSTIVNYLSLVTHGNVS